MIDLLKNHSFFADKQIDSCTLLENQGYCNENYLVVVDGVKYVVRKFLRDDIDREFEWKVQNLAYDEGITAEPLIYDSKHGFMVFLFLEGEHKSKLDENELKFLAKTLQKLHSITIDAKPIKLHTDTSRVECYPKEYVLCHNDLNPQNIFFSDELKFIDWEYAGVNDRYFDLACVCVEFVLDEGMQKIFLDAYFKGEDFSVEKLEAYKIIYKGLCEEWFQNNT
jgi:aminoglycoside phosphotransferase (APT) family kinase protein